MGDSRGRIDLAVTTAFEAGFISKPIHYNSICAYLENKDYMPILQSLVSQSSLPLKGVEVDFAPDSTGFSTSKFVRWFDEKYGVERSGHAWVKVHLICGVKTNIVSAVEILGPHAGDAPQFGPLVEKTRQNFTIREISADKGYLSEQNIEIAFRKSVPCPSSLSR